jgi:hypothetical protein
MPFAGHAQQVTTSTPFNSVNSSFNERMGVNFGFNIAGPRQLPGDDSGPSSVIGITPFGMATPNNAIQFRQGGAGNVAPGFGGGDPAAATTAGIGFRGGNFSGNLGFSFGQGSSTSNVSQTPMVTSMNGQPAMFSDQIQQPFVTSVTPVVNQWITGPRNPYLSLPNNSASIQPFRPIYQRYARMKQQQQTMPKKKAVEEDTPRIARPQTFDDRLRTAGSSTAGQAALSVAEIQRRHAAIDDARNREAQESFDRALAAEEAGKLGVAKIYYRMAAKDAVGELKQQAEERLRNVSGSDAYKR